MTGDRDTDLPDVRHLTIDDLTDPDAQAALAPHCETIIGQVERPRPNIGSGPPGRAD